MMLLTIHNIAKIKKANIELNGITVIAGENNTGKSTVGKTLYCMFNAFYDFADVLKHEKEIEIRYKVLHFLANSPVSDANTLQLSQTISKELNHIFPVTLENINKIITQFLGDKNLSEELDSNSRDNFVSDLYNVISIDETKLQQKVLTRSFKDEFHSQISHTDECNSMCSASLTIKGKKINVDFPNNSCISFSKNIDIVFEALYYDTPNVLDGLCDEDCYKDDYFLYKSVGHHQHLVKKLAKKTNSPISEILNEKKLKEVILIINDTVKGDFVKNSDHNIYFKEKGSSTPLNLSNLSMGLKTFAVLKRLIENGQLEEKGVLILDEPEIHLHPKWQLVFAEILVLLQKKFDLNVLLTTHSPYFLEAIEVYSQKHEIQNKCTYYLAELDESDNRFVTIENVGIDNLERIYQKLADPFKMLERIRDSLH